MIWQDIAGNGELNKWLLLLASFCTTLADGRPHAGGEIFFSTSGSKCQPGNGGDSDLSDYEVKAAWIAFLEQKAVKKVLGVVQDGNMKDLQKQLKENEDASQ